MLHMFFERASPELAARHLHAGKGTSHPAKMVGINIGGPLPGRRNGGLPPKNQLRARHLCISSADMKLLALFTILASFTLTSCESGPNARTGTALGALGGAAAGGIIGNQRGRGLEGAAIGAGLGALGGNMIGGAQDERNERAYYDNRRYDRRRYYEDRY